MRRIGSMLVLGFLAACGGAADEQPPVAPPPPPPAPSAVADTTPAPTATADTTPPPAAKPSMADMQQAALKVEVASANDAAKLAALYAPDATLFMAGFPEVKGREAIQKFNQDWIDGNPNLSMAVARTWTKGNVLVSEQVYGGTDKATGKPWGISALDIATFNDDGLITQDHLYADIVTMMKQLGTYKDERPFRPIATMPTSVEAHVSKGDASEDANVKSESALVDAVVKGDDKTALGFFSDDYVSNGVADPEPRDKKWLKDSFARQDKAFKDRSWKSWTLLGVEDFTIDEGENSATQAGSYDHGKVHVPNKHKSVTLHSVYVRQWKDGKVAKSWTWSNGQELDQQLQIRSAAPKPAAKPDAKKGAAAAKK